MKPALKAAVVAIGAIAISALYLGVTASVVQTAPSLRPVVFPEMYRFLVPTLLVAFIGWISLHKLCVGSPAIRIVTVLLFAVFAPHAGFYVAAFFQCIVLNASCF
jgi:hypothetical protein